MQVLNLIVLGVILIVSPDLRIPAFRFGCGLGLPIPVVVLVTLDVEGEVSREDACAQLQEAVAGLGRPDINVVNA